jgi:hypothetical protein
MKKTILIVLSFMITGLAAFGVLISQFRSWDDLIQISPDIVIAKCTSTYGTKSSTKKNLIIDDVIPSDVDVLSVLKGNTKPGPARLASQYWPYPGQQFVIFGWYSGGQYSAVEGYRVMPLNRDFPLSALNGKSLTEQMQLIFSNRLSNLNDEINQDEKDKASLEKYLKGQ